MEHRKSYVDKTWLAMLVLKMDPHVPPEEPYKIDLESNVCLWEAELEPRETHGIHQRLKLSFGVN